MLRKFSTKRIVGFLLLDWFGSLACLYLADWLRSRILDLPPGINEALQTMNIPIGGIQVTESVSVLTAVDLVAIMVGVIWPFFFAVFSIYDGRRSNNLRTELFNVCTAVSVSTLVLTGALYFTYRGTSRFMLVIFFFLDNGLLLGSRIALWGVHLLMNKRRRISHKVVLVVGAGAVGESAVRAIYRYGWTGIKLAGFIDDDAAKQGQTFADLQVLGTLDQIPDVVVVNRITDAVVALPLHAHSRLVEVCRQLQKLSVRVYVIPDLFALSFPNATMEGFGGIPAIGLGQPGLTEQQRLVKRAFDLVLASLCLILMAPFLIVIAILIKLDSPGPVLYKGTRIGENGKAFLMFKFRSMRIDGGEDIHKAHVVRLIRENIKPQQAGKGKSVSLKLQDDPRITRVGSFIRKTSIDELPQLFNVLRGDMSIVGPRPSLPYEVEVFQDWHMRRFEGPPGITGLWQVNGRNRVSFDEMVRLDIEYIEHQSLWLDCKILLQTPFAVISGNGAG